MKASDLTPEQIRTALRNAKGNYERNEQAMLARHVWRLWQQAQKKQPAEAGLKYLTVGTVK